MARRGAPARRGRPWLSLLLLFTAAPFVLLQIIVGSMYLLHVYRDRLTPEGALQKPLVLPRTQGRADLVHAIAADTGGWNALHPVLLAASREGSRVAVHFSGACAAKFRSGQLAPAPAAMSVYLADPPQPADPWRSADVADFVARPHDVTLVAASVSAEGSEGAARSVCGSAARAVAVVEDRYASSLRSLEEVVRRCPRAAASPRLVVLVADAIAQRLIAEHTPFRGSVVVTGAPMFDRDVNNRNADVNGAVRARERREVRDSLGVGPSELLLLLAGQTVGTFEMAALVVEAARRAAGDPVVRAVLRTHPRDTEEDIKRTQDLLQSAPAGMFLAEGSAVRARYRSSEALLPGADVVMSGYSSTNYYGILMNMAGVVYAATPELLAKFREDKHLEAAPEVTAGAAWAVQTPDDLLRVFRALTADPMPQSATRILEAQRSLTKYHDGQAALRAWREVASRLGA